MRSAIVASFAVQFVVTVQADVDDFVFLRQGAANDGVFAGPGEGGLRAELRFFGGVK